MKAELKPGFGHERVELHKHLPLETPFTLHIASSTICNFKCKYCVHSLDKSNFEKRGFNTSVMNWDIFTLAIEQAKEFKQKFKMVSLTGIGEPLCNKMLPEMIKYIKDSNITESIEFITNASLLNRETSIKLVDSGLDRIRISIQGLTSDKYEEVCGVRLDIEQLLSEIKFLYDNRKDCKIFIKTVDIALTENEDKDFYDMFGDISDRIFIEKIRPAFHGVDYSNLIKGKKVIDRYGNEHDERLICPQAFFAIAVWPNGEMYPCDMIDNPISLGNIKEVSIKDAWNGESRKHFLRMQLNKDRMSNEICKNCCSPNDVSQPEDELDQYADKLKSFF
ncbi:radical SAM protein [Clostridioides difficile]|nr:radical SAM protein [Clostridioides difficile]